MIRTVSALSLSLTVFCASLALAADKKPAAKAPAKPVHHMATKKHHHSRHRRHRGHRKPVKAMHHTAHKAAPKAPPAAAHHDMKKK